MESDARISPCGQYRYYLTRIWDLSLPPMIFVMLNPSTADAQTDDPTIRRCIGFAKREGCGAILVVNLSPFRATNPKEMRKHITGSEAWKFNQAHQRIALANAHVKNGKVVLAWGGHDAAGPFVAAFFENIRDIENKPQVYCLGRTSYGAPRHPLYVRADQPLEVYA